MELGIKRYLLCVIYILRRTIKSTPYFFDVLEDRIFELSTL